jgi:hypothetical protein
MRRACPLAVGGFIMREGRPIVATAAICMKSSLGVAAILRKMPQKLHREEPKCIN